MTPARRIAETLRQIRREDARRTADIRPAVVAGRNTDGTLRMTHLDGTCILTGEVGPEGTGAVVSLPTGPLADRGTTGVAGVVLHRESSTLWVERLDPDTYERSASYTVEVHGRGFTPGTLIDFLLWNSELVHPGITLLDLRFVSSELLELDIETAPDAELSRLDPVTHEWLPMPIAFDDLSVN